MGIEITKFRKYEKGVTKGFFTAKLTNIGLEIRDCVLNEKNGERWVNLPSRPYEQDGKTMYAPIVKFTEKDTWEKFKLATLAALDEILKVENHETDPKDSKIPF